ncbi:hypothetical protein N431DRAFT_552391 [Stipitochalara longipes BDJ]|nr:hypothetical protein N431DRAFT_552391 [Stipitochalara longipes BDJ]
MQRKSCWTRKYWVLVCGCVDPYQLRFGRKTEWITSLKITFTNTAVDSNVLQHIFNDLSHSQLRKLELEVLPSSGDARADSLSRPFYLLTSSNTKEFAAIEYDLLWRPLKSSLSRMDSIMSLVVVGFPNVEIEEAIFVLSMRMEERARLEGNGSRKVK